MSIFYSDTRITDPEHSVADWFHSTITAGKVARISGTPGCQILDSNGAELWWNIQQVFDAFISRQGYHKMSYPLLIPRSLFEKEEDHVEGFAPEFAVVHELKGTKLEDPLVLRPTSEVVIYDDFASQIRSRADLPMMVNQWCNVFRVEMRTRPLMRTMEFQWHEAHWAIVDKDEAIAHTHEVLLDGYAQFMEEVLAIPVVAGEKTAMERFAGAEMTLTVEARMLDGKALQCGTSHMMGTGFAKAYDIGYSTGQNEIEHPFTGSWGMSTRILGAIVMTHSDNRGLSLPPAIAPVQCVLMTVEPNDTDCEAFLQSVENLKLALEQSGARFRVDAMPVRLGKKQFHWEKQGVPVRLIFGPNEMASDSVTLVRRDTGEVIKMTEAEIPGALPALLDRIQKDMFQHAKKRLADNLIKVETLDEFEVAIASQANAFIAAGWSNDRDAEIRLKEEYGYTIRCLPFDPNTDFETCFLTGRPAKAQALIAKSY